MSSIIKRNRAALSSDSSSGSPEAVKFIKTDSGKMAQQPLDVHAKNVIDNLNNVPAWARPLCKLIATMATSQHASHTEFLQTKESLGRRIIQSELVIKQLKDKITSLESEKSDLKERLISLEAYQRRENLVFHGIEEAAAWESFNVLKDKVCNQILHKLNIPNYERIKFDRIHRLGQKRENQTRPRPIIAKFTYYSDKEAVLYGNHHLRGTQYYISEDYPKEIQDERRRLYPYFKAAQKVYDKKQVKLRVNKLIIPAGKFDIYNLHTLPEGLRPRDLALKMDDNFVFYFGKDSMLSNHNGDCPFTIGTTTYKNAAQYINVKKALYFNDRETAENIMKIEDPVAIKQLGKRIKNFDRTRWIDVCKDEIRPGIEEKFKQNNNARDLLLSTGNRDIAECSPYEKDMGIGIAMHDDRRLNKDNWGTNIMGTLYVEIRDGLNNSNL